MIPVVSSFHVMLAWAHHDAIIPRQFVFVGDSRCGSAHFIAFMYLVCLSSVTQLLTSQECFQPESIFPVDCFLPVAHTPFCNSLFAHIQGEWKNQYILCETRQSGDVWKHDRVHNSIWCTATQCYTISANVWTFTLNFSKKNMNLNLLWLMCSSVGT